MEAKGNKRPTEMRTKEENQKENGWRRTKIER